MGIFDIFKKQQKENNSEEQNLKENPSDEDILNEEKNYLDNCGENHYDFFGYLGFQDSELPFFEEINKEDDSSSMFLPFTPKLLSHCVHNLSNRAVLAQELDEFKQKCQELARAAKYQPRNDFNGWQQTIDRLCDFIYERQLLLTSRPDLFRYAQNDWLKLGKDFKKHQCLPPSYQTKPSRVRVYNDKNGNSCATLTFESTSSDSYRIVRITDAGVYVCVNNQTNGLRDEEMTVVWNNFKISKCNNSSQDDEDLTK